LKTTSQIFDSQTANLIASLQEHQIELEMQNQELAKAKEAADSATQKYSELYDFAPSGYFVLSTSGEILELNLSGSQMLGKDRHHLINLGFGFFVSDDTKGEFSLLLDRIFKSKVKQTCEVTFAPAGLPLIFVQLCGVISGNGDSCLLTAIDITSRKISEAQLERTSLLMQSSIESQKEVIFLSVDTDFRYLYFNKAHSDLMMLAYQIRIALGQNILECISSESERAIIKDHFDRAFMGEAHTRIWNFDNGMLNYYESYFNPIINESAQILGATSFSRDITQRKYADELLRESKVRLDKTQQMAHLGSWEMDLSTGQLFWSDEVYRIFGLVAQEFEATYEAFLKAVHPDDRDPVNFTYFSSIDENKPGFEIEHRVIRRHTGEVRHVYEKCEHIRDNSGQIVRSLGMVQDITERKLSELALIESKAQISTILAAIPDMIFIMSREGVYLDYRGPLSGDLYIKPELFIGKNISDVLPADVAQLFLETFATVFLTNEVQLCEYSLNLPEGLNYFEAKIAPYSVSKFLVIIRNVSSHKHSEATIKAKNNDLQRVNGEKDKFFSIIAHDLRGPFSGFLGLTEVLAKRLPDMTLKEIHELTLLMRNSAVHLFRLLGNLLEWSRMQGGVMPFNPDFIPLDSKITVCLEMIEEIAKLKDISIDYERGGGISIFADENMLESIIRNLLSYAVKFTPRKGSITISTKLHSDNSVEISVKDSGIGMHPHLIDQLFRIDLRSNRKGTEGENSTGLGLILCKDFIDKHCGRLHVESRVDVGSIFRFTIPGNHQQ